MSKKTKVRVGTDLHTTANTLEKVLQQLGGNLYQRAGLLCQVTRTKEIRGSCGGEAPVIVPVNKHYIRDLASKAAYWISEKAEGETRSIKPPLDAIEVLLARGSWGLPPLTGVIETPTLRPGGTVIHSAGYDEETGLLYDPGSVSFPSIPRKPGRKEALAALDVLVEPFVDFPLVSESDQAATFAAILTLIGRHAIIGPVPMFAVRATVAGTGKTLLADAISIIGTGRPAPRYTQVHKEDDERKRLLAVAISGDSLMLIDNVTYPLGNGALDAALTSTTIKDRLLGGNQIVTAPWRAVLLATGNNMQFRGDTARRAILIDLDPKVEDPEERQDFTHKQLLPWVARQRPRLAVAALTILRAYCATGKPRPSLPGFGSFEAWSNLVRGSLVWLGAADPCQGRQRIRREGDHEREALACALEAWRTRYGLAGKTLAEVAKELRGSCTEDDFSFITALGGLDISFDGTNLKSRKIGAALRKHRGHIVGGLYFSSSPGSSASVWRIEMADQADLAGQPPGRDEKDCGGA